MGKQAIAIFVGSVCIAVGINYFLIPNHLINGGLIGAGLIAKYAFGFRPGLTTLILSVPLYIIAWFYFRKYFYNGLHGLFVCSLFIDLFHPLSTWTNSAPILFSTIVGGVLIGVGVSLMLLVKVSTGGGDLLALMISKITSINVGIIILIIDMIVILLGGFTIREEAIILYSFIMIVMIGITTYTITHRFASRDPAV